MTKLRGDTSPLDECAACGAHTIRMTPMLDSRAGEDLTPRERIARVVAWEHFGIAWHHMEKQSHADVLAMVDRMLDSRAGDAWEESEALTGPQLDSVLDAINFVLAGEFDKNAFAHGEAVMERAYSKLSGLKGRTRRVSATPVPAVDAPEPFGYWVEQKHADPVLLRKPAYIPAPSDLRTVTPLYAAPAVDAEDRRPDGGPVPGDAGAKDALLIEHLRMKTGYDLEKAAMLAADRLAALSATPAPAVDAPTERQIALAKLTAMDDDGLPDEPLPISPSAVDAATRGDIKKAKHHTISTGAALANWHAALTGADIKMRPGISAEAQAAAEGRGAVSLALQTAALSHGEGRK